MRISGSTDVAQALRDIIELEAAAEVDDVSEFLLDAAVRRSSGPFSQSQLDAMDNPYAKRHGRPILEPFNVNDQTGTFRRSWEPRQVGALHAQVVNTDPKAKYLVTEDEQGTEFMFHRGVDDAAQEDTLRAFPHVSRS